MSPGPISAEPAPVPDGATQHFVRMRDSVRLATDVYLPDTSDAVPAVLIRLPYDKNSRYVFMESVAQRVTRAGYALIVQDVRGKFRSEGEPRGPVNEANDGYDTLQWISSSDWSNGRVGMFGDSYYGFTQWAAVSSGHPALRAIVPRVTSSRLPLFDLRTRDGVRDIPWMTFADYMMQCWTGSGVNEVRPNLTVRPLLAAYNQRFEELGERSYWFDNIIPHTQAMPVYPDRHPFTARPLPVLHCVGWWDNVSIPSMRDYEELLSLPEWAPLQYLWADSTDHENYHLNNAPIQADADHNQNDEALERLMDIYIEPALRFFNVFVKGEGSPDDIPKVQWHQGHVGYLESQQWPPRGSQTTSLFLHDLSSMTTAGGRLTEDPPSTSEAGDWRFDPDNLIPASAESSWSFLLEYPDERGVALRNDVAVFNTAPFDDDVDLAGPITLWVRTDSDAVTADVLAKLFDISPDGSAHMIVRGQGEVLEPNPEKLRAIEMGHTGYRVRAGHRLRLLIASSEMPELPPNPGDGKNRWVAEACAPATHRLHTDALAPSRIDITVLPVVTPAVRLNSKR
jgi:predicted acyl esterase